MFKTIANLRIGEKAFIEKLCLENIPLELLEMGCLPGIEVQLIQTAPLNDPLYIKVKGSHLAIRRETAEKITVVN
jgi:ferrous iron transport protein A